MDNSIKKLVLIILLIAGFIYAEEKKQAIHKDKSQITTLTTLETIAKYRNHKNNLSYGLFDSRIGNTFISYNFDFYQNNVLNNELFIGLGTAVISTNISLGYKQYYSTKKNSIFSVASVHLSAITYNPKTKELGDWNIPNQIGIFPTIALGLERKINRVNSIQYGLFFVYMITDYGYEYGFIPFINIDHRF